MSNLKLPKEYNLSHPQFKLGRIAQKAALERIMQSRHIASPGHFVRWQVNDWGELESEKGRCST